MVILRFFTLKLTAVEVIGVFEVLVVAVWYMLPAGAGNMTPVLVAKLPKFKNWTAPLDGGKTWRQKPIFGKNKTWRGLITGVMAGLLVGFLQTKLFYLVDATHLPSSIYATNNAIWLGGLLAFGALAGDFLESFLKRQVNVASGDSWFPFDQLDYIIGACLLGALILPLGMIDYVAICLIWFGLHLLTSYLGFVIGLKQKPI